MTKFMLHRRLILRDLHTLPLVQGNSGVQHPRVFKLTYLNIETYRNMI